jgi:hypothetical protein
LSFLDISSAEGALISTAVFLSVTVPYIAALSQAEHRFTFGDIAKLNLAWHADGVPNTNWQGGPAENGQPSHPTRQTVSASQRFSSSGNPWLEPTRLGTTRLTGTRAYVLRATFGKSFTRLQTSFGFMPIFFTIDSRR